MRNVLTFRIQPVDPQQAGAVRFSGLAYSGGVVPNYGWLGNVAIDLSSMETPDGAEVPVLADHQRSLSAIAGKGRVRRVRDPQTGHLSLVIEGETTESTDAGMQAARLLREGYPLQMSVGINASFREVKDASDINGRVGLRVKGVFEGVRVSEVSFVPVGADPNTYTEAIFSASAGREAAIHFHKENPTMSDTTEIDALRERNRELQAQLDALQAQRRTEQLAAVMAEVGRDTPQGDALKPYLEMSDAAFSAFAADLRAVAHAARKQAGPSLFASQAVGRASAADTPQPSGMAAAFQRLTGQPLRT